MNGFDCMHHIASDAVPLCMSNLRQLSSSMHLGQSRPLYPQASVMYCLVTKRDCIISLHCTHHIAWRVDPQLHVTAPLLSARGELAFIEFMTFPMKLPCSPRSTASAAHEA